MTNVEYLRGIDRWPEPAQWVLLSLAFNGAQPPAEKIWCKRALISAS